MLSALRTKLVWRLKRRLQRGSHGQSGQVGVGAIWWMTTVRRAFVLASIGRYLTMAINLAAVLIMARLLAPADYGVAVLGGSVLSVAEAVRALGGGAYLVQQKDLTQAQ